MAKELLETPLTVKEVTRISRDAGELSRLVAQVLPTSAEEGIRGTVIIHKVEELLAGNPGKPQEINHSTVHHALLRMREVGLAKRSGMPVYDYVYPIGLRTSALFSLTEKGAQILASEELKVAFLNPPQPLRERIAEVVVRAFYSIRS